jgi:hypothetical protein
MFFRTIITPIKTMPPIKKFRFQVIVCRFVFCFGCNRGGIFGFRRPRRGLHADAYGMGVAEVIVVTGVTVSQSDGQW